MEYNWNTPKTMPVKVPLEKGMLVKIMVEVDAFVTETDVVTDWDEDGNTLDSKKGLLLNLIDNKVLYKGQDFVYMGRAQEIKK